MSISSYEKNGKVFWRVYVNLRSKVDPTIRAQKHSHGFTTEAAAISEEKKLLRKLGEELARLEGFGAIWETVIDRWELSMRAAGYQKQQQTTVMDHVALLRKWTKSWLQMPASELSKGDGRQIFNELEAAGKTQAFQKKVKNTINVVFNWGNEEKIIRGAHESPVQGIKVVKDKNEKLPEILTVLEIRKLLKEGKRMEHKWFPIWTLALLTGMRNGELYSLLWSDVDFERRQITVSKSYNTRLKIIKSTKSGYWRTVPISDELHNFLLELKLTAGKRPQVLPRFRNWDKGEQARVLRMFCVGIGIPPVKFHTLRACFATQLLANDVAPARVMKICGWKDLKTMQHYIRLAGVDERGATDSLRLLSSDAEAMGEVINMFDFKPGGPKQG